MALKQYIEDAIRKCETEKATAVNAAKEKATRETIVPFNTESDRIRDAAIAKHLSEMNDAISSVQSQFAQKKQEINDANENKKRSNAEAVLAAATASVAATYDATIAKLRTILDSVKE